jgi:hypothetical protein
MEPIKPAKGNAFVQRMSRIVPYRKALGKFFAQRQRGGFRTYPGSVVSGLIEPHRVDLRRKLPHFWSAVQNGKVRISIYEETETLQHKY